MGEIEKFTEPRPRIPLQADVRIKKDVKVVSDFTSTINEKLNQIQSKHPAKALKSEQYDASTKAAKTASSFASISKFLTDSHKLDIQYIGSIANYEDTKAATYKTKDQIRDLLPKIQVAAEYASAAQRKRKARTFDSNGNSIELLSDEQKVGFEAGKGDTYLLNATLFPRLTSNNPMERGDKLNYDRFQNGTAYHAENAPLESTLRYLNDMIPGIGTKMTQVLDKVIDRNKKYSVQFADQFKANDIETTEVNLGFDDIFRTPEIYKKLNDQEKFMVVMSAFDNVMRFHKNFSSIYGTGPQATLIGDPKSKIDVKAESKKSTDRATKWFADMKENVDDPTMLLAVMLTKKIAGTISQQVNWGAMTISTQEAKQFDDPRQVIVDGFFTYFDKEYAKGFKSERTVKLEDIMSDNDRQSKQIWSALISQGYVDENGKIANAFDIDNPNFKIGLGIDVDAEALVQDKIRSKFLGDFSIEGADSTLVGDSKRQSQKIKNYHTGKYEDLGTILSKIGIGTTWKQKIDSTTDSYESLLGIYRNITGAKDNVMTTQVSGEPTEKGGFKVTVSKDGQWNQHIEGPTGMTWQKVTGQPLEIEFKTKNDAQKFTDKVLAAIQFIAPVVGMFNSEKAPVLMDNPDKEGSLILARRVDYDNEIFEKSQKVVAGGIENIMMIEGFTKISINREQYRSFKIKLAQWDDREEEFYDSEIDRVKKEDEVRMDETKEQKRIEAEMKKRRVEEIAEAKKQEAENAGRGKSDKKKDDK